MINKFAIVDLDNVLADSHMQLQYELREKHGYEINLDDFISGKWIVPKERRDLIEKILDVFQSGFFSRVPVMPGADTGFRNLYSFLTERHCQPLIVTAPPRRWLTDNEPFGVEDKKEWVVRNFPFVSEKEIIVSSNKEKFADNSLMYLEDDYSLLSELGRRRKAHPDLLLICFRRPWNSSSFLNSANLGIETAKNWIEVMEVVYRKLGHLRMDGEREEDYNGEN